MTRLQSRQAREPALPMALVVVLIWVGTQRLFWIWLLARFPPNPVVVWNSQGLTGFWEVWHGPGPWAGSLRACFMVVNVLFAVYLWAQFRGLPRGSFRSRCVQLAAYGGAALLLLQLQFALTEASFIAPNYGAVAVDLESTRVLLP